MTHTLPPPPTPTAGKVIGGLFPSEDKDSRTIKARRLGLAQTTYFSFSKSVFPDHTCAERLLEGQRGVMSRDVLCSVTSIMSDSLGPMDCSPPGFSAHGILQARILEWVPTGMFYTDPFR